MLALALFGPAVDLLAQPAPPGGIVVEEVSKGSAGEKAGILPGDLLLSWNVPARPHSRTTAVAGELRSPAHAREVELAEGGRGDVTLSGSREDAPRSFVLKGPIWSWGLRLRPPLSAQSLAAYEEGKDLLEKKDLTNAVAAWRTLAAEADRKAERETAAWLNARIAQAFSEARKWEEAQKAYDEALGQAREAGNLMAVAQLWDAKGTAYKRQNELTKSAESYRESLTVREGMRPGNPASITNVLDDLGILAFQRGDTDEARARFRRSLAIRRKLAPGSVAVARSLNHLGATENQDWNLAAAEKLLRESLAITDKISSTESGGALNNLGMVARRRGDFAASEDFYRRTIAIQKKTDPESLRMATVLNNLGVQLNEAGDEAAAERTHREALAIREKLAPGSLDVAASLANLGVVASGRGDLVAAEDFHRRALAIQEKAAPNTLNVATILQSLGGVAEKREDLPAAEELFGRALTIQERLAPQSAYAGNTLYRLGRLAEKRGDLNAAEDRIEKSLAIHARVNPGSQNEATSLHALGMLARKAGRLEEAAGLLRRAVAALESQRTKLGGTQETKSGFTARYADYYLDYIELLLELDRRAEAFHVLERFRARGLLAMLAERDILFDEEIPTDLASARRRADFEYDATQASIGRLHGVKDVAEIERLLVRLKELRARQDEIVREIRKASPRLAALKYSQPLDLAGTRDALDPGTVLLSYAVGEKKSFLFAVTPKAATPDVSVFVLPIGEETLRKEVQVFRALIAEKRDPASGPSEALISQARFLYDRLLAPAEGAIAASQRVQILPDGALHALPFGALVRRPQAGADQFFVEWKPFVTAASATVFAELRRSRVKGGRPGSGPLLVAFGDPRYPKLASRTWDSSRGSEEEGGGSPPEEDATAADPEVRSAVARGHSLEPLPATRREVETIAKLYVPRAAKFLGAEATEERATAIPKGTRIVHFACHGILDSSIPLNSALALTIPEKPSEGQANGLLQAWEIFERIRLDADLVTLSACETGLGREVRGEGLVGLTRAFQYAGARAVLASLWKVTDKPTGELMRRFYENLKSGKTKDEALRNAQREMIRTAGRGEASLPFSHPFHWAAFQVAGDWR